MFEIPDDDILWNDDLPLEGFDEEVTFAGNSKSLDFKSHSATIVEQDEFVKQLRKQECSKAITIAHQHTYGVDKQGPQKDAHNDTFVACNKELTSIGKRKFPGPAGVLPPSPLPELNAKFHNIPDVSRSKSLTIGDLKERPHQVSWSQTPADDVFASTQWKELISDLGKDAHELLNKFSIKSALLKANRKLLHKGKLPLIIGVMDSFEMQGSDASFVLRDPSGKMNGALHRDLFKDPSTALQAGSVLVLRQVSVISPSSRTHYLNITPGNVALIYTANRDAIVSKRCWQVSQSLTNDTKFDTRDSETQLLCDIIADSQKEMVDYLRNSHRRNSTCLSQSSSPGPAEFHLRNANSGYMSSFTPRGAIASHTARGNFKSVGSSSSRSVPSKSSLFASTPTSIYSSFRRNVGHSVIIGNTTGNVMQSLNQAESKKVYSTTEPQPDLHVNRGVNQVDGNNETLSNVDIFNDDFSDSDDQMMIQVCDKVLSQSLVEACGQQTNSYVVNRPGVLDSNYEKIKCDFAPQSVISKVFEDCRKENQKIFNNSENVHISKTNYLLSDTRDKLNLAGKSSTDLKIESSCASVIGTPQNQTVLSQTSSAVNKFSFKRCSTPSPTLTSIKRPMYNVANENAVDSVRSLLNYQKDLQKVNSCVTSSMVARLPTYHTTCASAVQSNVPSTNSPVKPSVSSIKPVPSVMPSTSSFCDSALTINNVAICGTIKFSEENTVGNKTLMKSEKSSERNFYDNQATRSYDSSSHTITSIFSHWDDDLNDDLLLSQMSDEF